MISHIDHLVLTVGDIEASVAFYKRALLLTDSTFANGRRALHFGNQKINLQVLGRRPGIMPRSGRGTCAS